MQVLVPALTIVKTADASGAVPGQVIGYTITVTNTGQTPYTGTAVTDSFAEMLDDAAYNGDATASAGTVSYTSPDLTWTGDLAPSAAVVIHYTVTVNSNPASGDKVVINTVTSAAVGSTCLPGTTAPACRITIAVLTPALTITTTPGAPTAIPGGTVTYTTTVADTGQTPYTGATVTASLAGILDDASYGGGATATTGSVSFTSPNLTWTGNLAPGDTATITYTVTVNNPDTGNHILATTITSATAGSNCGTGSTDPRCASSVDVVNATTLTFTQSTGANSTTAGSVVNYTITVANSGLSPYVDATFTEPLTGILDDASDPAGLTATAGTASFSSPDLTWTGTVPASGTVTITFSVTVISPDTGNHILATTITSASAGSNCASGSTDPRCASTVTVSDLVINFTADASTTTPGSVVRYTATLTNAGQTPYFGISVSTDATGISDDATGNGDQTASAGTLSIGPTGAVWTGDIPVSGTVTITSTATVNNPDTGDHVLTATAVSAAPGSNCPAGSTDPRCTPVTTVLTPALSIVKTADASSAVPGQEIGYTITVTNTGQTPYTGTAVTDSFAQMADDAVYDGGATASTGSLSYASPVLTWTGDLAPSAAVVIHYTVTVDNPDTGDKLVINTVTSAAAGLHLPARHHHPGLPHHPARADPRPDHHHHPQRAHLGPRRDSYLHHHRGRHRPDPLHRRHRRRRPDRDAGRRQRPQRPDRHHRHRQLRQPTLTWTGNLAPGDTATITYTVTVHNPETGDKILTNTVSLGRRRQQLRHRIRRPALRQHGDGGAAGHRLHRRCQHHHSRRRGALHHHADQLRADPLRRHHHEQRRQRPG